MDPVVETNEVSILSESLREANKKIEEKNQFIEDLKSQCEIVTEKIGSEWKECMEERLLEIHALKVFKIKQYFL